MKKIIFAAIMLMIGFNIFALEASTGNVFKYLKGTSTQYAKIVSILPYQNGFVIKVKDSQSPEVYELYVEKDDEICITPMIDDRTFFVSPRVNASKQSYSSEYEIVRIKILNIWANGFKFEISKY